nr:hypothetical protein [Streptomyces sp. GMY02]
MPLLSGRQPPRGGLPGSERTNAPLNDCAVMEPSRMFSSTSSASSVRL